MPDLSLGLYVTISVTYALMIIATIAAHETRSTVWVIVLAQAAVAAFSIILFPILLVAFGG